MPRTRASGQGNASAAISRLPARSIAPTARPTAGRPHPERFPDPGTAARHTWARLVQPTMTSRARHAFVSCLRIIPTPMVALRNDGGHQMDKAVHRAENRFLPRDAPRQTGNFVAHLHRTATEDKGTIEGIITPLRPECIRHRTRSQRPSAGGGQSDCFFLSTNAEIAGPERAVDVATHQAFSSQSPYSCEPVPSLQNKLPRDPGTGLDSDNGSSTNPIT